MPWRLRGEYVESCNCEVLCPCLLGPRDARGLALARPTEGHCDVHMIFRITAGAFDGLALGDLAVVQTVHAPGPMGEGNWTVGLYLDERASPEQRQALEAIFTGQAGGPTARLALLVGRRLPTRMVPIRFELEGRVRRAGIPGILDVEVEAIVGADRAAEVWLDNAPHFAARRLAAARSRRSTYRDHDFVWETTGRNAYYAPFDWSAP